MINARARHPTLPMGRNTSVNKDDKRHGQGTNTYADGEKYVGEYKDDNRHGQGTYTYADGRIEEGIWGEDAFLSTDDKVDGDFLAPSSLLTGTAGTGVDAGTVVPETSADETVVEGIPADRVVPRARKPRTDGRQSVYDEVTTGDTPLTLGDLETATPTRGQMGNLQEHSF
jgi:hypothetical protein